MSKAKTVERRQAGAKHARIYRSVANTDAWRNLSGNAVKVLIALVMLDDGERNGKIFLSARDAALATGLSKNTASRCLTELDDHGFIKAVARGHFKVKGGPATVWRYTWQPAPGCKPANPTRDFEKWAPNGNKTRYQNLTSAVPNIAQGVETDPNAVPNFDTETSGNPHVSVKDTVPKTGTQLNYHTQGKAGTARQEETETSPLREILIELIKQSPIGTQSKLAEEAGIPKGTMSKFVNGAGLALHHQTALKLELTKIGKICTTNKLERN
ncbi:hypothetical protein [Parasphingorhabdus sp.]|uniref:hypothetical protein n=1 Tax=Parasphingorhabdus sp. TaxID=2709688 RepID=UPI003BAEFFC0